MPPRRAVDDPAAELERLRTMARDRQRRKRLRDTVTERGNVTRSQSTARPVPPPAPPVSPLSLTEIETALAPFAGRGYVHSERFWQLAASEYPALNLELEALKIADWLLTPKNAKRRCSKGFLDNWLKKAEQDRRERELTPAPRPAVRPAPGRPPDPERVLPADVVLQRIDPRVAQRALAAAKRLTLPQKLALVTNGRHR